MRKNKVTIQTCFRRIFDDYAQDHLIKPQLNDNEEEGDRKSVRHLIFMICGMKYGLKELLGSNFSISNEIRSIALQGSEIIQDHIGNIESYKIPIIADNLESNEDFEILVSLFAMNLSYDDLYTALDKIDFINQIPCGNIHEIIHYLKNDSYAVKKSQDLKLKMFEVVSMALYKGQGELDLHEEYNYGFRAFTIINNYRKVGIIVFRGSSETRDWCADAHMISRALPLGKQDTMARALANYIINATIISTGATGLTALTMGPAAALGVFLSSACATPLVSELYLKKILDSYEVSAISYFEKMCRRYPTCNFYISGHSLGGYLAQYVCYKTQSDGFAVNSPGLKKDDLRYGGRLKNIKSNIDPVSMCSSDGRIGENCVYNITTELEGEDKASFYDKVSICHSVQPTLKKINKKLAERIN